MVLQPAFAGLLTGADIASMDIHEGIHGTG